MIKKALSLPHLQRISAEGIKIKNIFLSYKSEVYVQDEAKAFISLLDGDVCLQNIDADIEELRSFLDFIKPRSLFSDSETLKSLGYKDFQKANVLFKECGETADLKSDTLKSDQVYALLLKGGFNLPKYEFFATDFCKRLNCGTLNYFAVKDKGVAIAITADDFCLLNGIVSLQKGFGTAALKGIMAQNGGKTMVVCCTDQVKEFYFKNGFSHLYDAGYVLEDV